MTHSTIMTYTVGAVLGLACLGGAVALALSPQAGSGADPVRSVVSNQAAKSDRKVAQSSLDPVQVRCVAGADSSTCTGWPVAATFQVSGL